MQLINATGNKDEELAQSGERSFNRFWEKMPRSLGNKRKQVAENGEEKGIGFITRLYGDFAENEFVKILPNDFFGYRRVVVERPQKDENGAVVTGRDGSPKADANLRDYENIPFLRKDPEDAGGKLILQSINEYFQREVKPHLPDAWIDESRLKLATRLTSPNTFTSSNPCALWPRLRLISWPWKKAAWNGKESGGMMSQKQQNIIICHRSRQDQCPSLCAGWHGLDEPMNSR